MNTYQRRFHSICLKHPKFGVAKILNPSELNMWLTWNCSRIKLKGRCDQILPTNSMNNNYPDFNSKLRKSNHLNEEYDNFQKPSKSATTDEQAIKSLRLKAKPTTGLENYNYLQSTWEQENMTTFCDFLQW